MSTLDNFWQIYHIYNFFYRLYIHIDTLAYQITMNYDRQKLVGKSALFDHMKSQTRVFAYTKNKVSFFKSSQNKIYSINPYKMFTV